MSKSEKFLNCPNCNDFKMKKITCGPELMVDQCPECLGVWLDANVLSSLKKQGNFYIKEIDKGLKKDIKINNDRVCPRCNIKLVPVKPEGFENIIIDSCKNCKGVWLDRGELIDLTK
jgi:Zn-finger nucleic acid-binding protein